MAIFLVLLQQAVDQIQANPAVANTLAGAVILAIAGALIYLVRHLGIRYGEAKLATWQAEVEAKIKTAQYERDRVAFREDRYFDALTAHLQSMEDFQEQLRAEMNKMNLYINQFQNTMRVQNEILSEIHEFLRSASKEWWGKNND